MRLISLERKRTAKARALAALLLVPLLFNGRGQVWIIDIQKP